VKIRDFQPTDALSLKQVANHGEEFAPRWEEAFSLLEQRSQYPAWTITDETGVVLAVCGVWPIHSERGAVWAAIGADVVRDHPATVARVGRLIVRMMQEEFPRIEAEIPVDWIVNARYAQWLGFEYEGVMKRSWVDGSDTYMLARVDYANN